MKREEAIKLADQLTAKGAVWVAVSSESLGYSVQQDEGELYEWRVAIDVDDMTTEHMKQAIQLVEEGGYAGTFNGSRLNIS